MREREKRCRIVVSRELKEKGGRAAFKVGFFETRMDDAHCVISVGLIGKKKPALLLE